jgi:hypothetical protein
MTTGRSGSTALIEALASDDVLLPSQLFDCPDSELLHPKRSPDYMRWFSGKLQRKILSSNELIDAFFAWPTEANFVGFKSMPNRHNDYATFAARKDVQFITLVRDDVASTAASFRMASLRRGQWLRKGEEQTQRWTFTERDVPPVFGNLFYLLTARALIERIPGAIPLSYEKMCAADFRNDALDHYFGRHIRLANPRPPVSASSYVTNWDVFVRFVNGISEQINSIIGPDLEQVISGTETLRLHPNRPLQASSTDLGPDLAFTVFKHQSGN